VAVDPAVNVGFAAEVPEHPRPLNLPHVPDTVTAEVLPLDVREMEILEVLGFHQPHGFLGIHGPEGRERKSWSQWSGLNRRPTVYETVALPLSYTGVAACPIHCGSRAGFVGGTKAVGKWDFGMGVKLIGSSEFSVSSFKSVPRSQKPLPQ
jgi:hypothetical protein